MTNGEWIRSLSDEELSELRVIGRQHCNLVICEEHHGDCRRCALEWLKSQHEPKSCEKT